MAEITTVARPYAKAVFEVARESNQIELWSSLLKSLAFIVQNEQVKLLLRDSTIPTVKMRDFIFAVAAKILIEPARNLIDILASRRRLNILPAVSTMFEKLRQDADNTVDVEFKTPIQVSDTEKATYQKVLEKLLSRTVIMYCEVDKNLLGGFQARAGNTIVDGSIRGFLTQMKEAIGG